MSHLFAGATLVHEGQIETGDLLVEGGTIQAIGPDLKSHSDPAIASAARSATLHNCEGLHLLPGLIDDQVHFREPGLTHKAEIATESRAAVAGGITSFMEMPNTVPQSLTQGLLQEKYNRAEQVSPANYSFFMGASNGNLDEVLKTDPKRVCGVKVFMGSSTGDMLVDDATVLEGIFKECPMLIATHCEDEATIRANAAAAREQFGEEVPMGQHPLIRSAEACYRSSSRAVELAAKTGARLHVLHISTARELSLFNGALPLSEKRITAEACTHHLWFTDADYAQRGSHIKWNPAVKTEEDRTAIREALKPGGAIDVLATDHAPHTASEKANSYWSAPSGGPLVQHTLSALYEGVSQGWLNSHRHSPFDRPSGGRTVQHPQPRLLEARLRRRLRFGEPRIDMDRRTRRHLEQMWLVPFYGRHLFRSSGGNLGQRHSSVGRREHIGTGRRSVSGRSALDF